MVLESFFGMLVGGLNFVFGPLLFLPSFWVVFIISLIASFIASIIYKFTTDQKLMKQLKEEQKELQKQARAEKGPKALEHQKKAMHISLKQMTHSMRSTLFTFFPLIIIFLWLSANLSYMPIKPGMEFATTISFEPGITGNAEIIVPEGIEVIGERTKPIEANSTENFFVQWNLKGREGEYLLEYRFNEKSYTKDVLITGKQAYKPVAKKIGKEGIREISIDNADNKFINIGFIKMGWLLTYIILSIIFSLVLRKVMNLY